MKECNLVSISGGKDSTATLLVALERGVPNLMGVFADTGNEHPSTYEFVRYLESETGVPIEWVQASFEERIRKKRERLLSGNHDWPEKAARRAAEVMYPTGNQFLDLCLVSGRFPSSAAQFCTRELKSEPIQEQVYLPLLREYDRLVSWQGMRRDESRRRSQIKEWSVEMGDPDTGEGIWLYRPILDWTYQDVFDMHRKMGIEWNPLYEQGMSRVGCMPCIHCTKSELAQIAKRFPEEIDRIEEWERLVSEAAKGGATTFLSATKKGEKASLEEHGIRSRVEWSKTTHGGKQYDLIKVADDSPGCESEYGLCE